MIHGEGVYFTESLDYCWYYGNTGGNRENLNIIPKIDETFTLIASSIYFDKTRKEIVDNSEYTPKKNEINFAYVDSNTDTIAKPKYGTEVKPDFTKFIGTEYVIWDLNQICPFMSAKLKRNEFCIVWRDNNFSAKPIYNNEFDNIFKEF